MSCQKGNGKSALCLLIYMNTTSAVLLHPAQRKQVCLKQQNSQTKTKDGAFLCAFASPATPLHKPIVSFVFSVASFIWRDLNWTHARNPDV